MCIQDHSFAASLVLSSSWLLWLESLEWVLSSTLPLLVVVSASPSLLILIHLIFLWCFGLSKTFSCFHSLPVQCMNMCVYKYLSYKPSSHNWKKNPNSNDYIPYTTSMIYHVCILFPGTFWVLYSTNSVLSVIEKSWLFIYKEIFQSIVKYASKPFSNNHIFISCGNLHTASIHS